jgi:hypothetical protein
MIRDIDVRDAMKSVEWMQASHDVEQTKVFQEFGLLNGSVRADVVVVNGLLHAFEIKSEVDNLLRLPKQTEAYSAIFDRVTLITTARHLEKAKSVVPDWWGVSIAFEEQGAVVIQVERPAELNISIDPLSLARLLWRDEALAVMAASGAIGFKSKPRKVLWKWLVENLSLDELRVIVRSTLKSRQHPDLLRGQR